MKFKNVNRECYAFLVKIYSTLKIVKKHRETAFAIKKCADYCMGNMLMKEVE